MAEELKSWAIPEERLKRGYTAAELFVRLKLVNSPEELTTQIGQKSASVNGQAVTSLDQFISLTDVKNGRIELKTAHDFGVIEPAVME